MARKKSLVQVSYRNAVGIIKDTARKAGIKKRVYTHLLRHTAATRDAHHLAEPESRIKFGWSRFSNMPSLYCHLAARDVDEKLISVYGVGKELKEPKKPVFTLLSCPKCNESNTSGMRFCGRYGFPIDAGRLL